jgi:type IV pilus assembly protein PilQ
MLKNQAGKTASPGNLPLLKTPAAGQEQPAPETVPASTADLKDRQALPPRQTYENAIRRTTSAGGDRFSIHIRDEDIRTVLELLGKEGRLNILASPNVQGTVSATLSDVGIDSALDAILKSTGYQAKREGTYIFVGNGEDLTKMARTVTQLKTRVYYPSYVTATELQTLITPILTEGVGVSSVTSRALSGIPANITDAGGDNYAGGEALLVRDYESVLFEIDRLVGEVDRRPLQVHIEAMILSVKLDDENKFGVSFQLLRQFNNLRFGWGNVPENFDEWTFDGGLKFGFLDQTLGAFIEALEKAGDTNVIATPRLMVLNKHAAEIQIGRSEGYVNTTQTETAATQTVEFLELGTLLRIRPFVSPDGMIRLEVHPEISDGEVDVREGLTLPNKDVTQVTTNVMVRDGCTAVIGGLIQDKQEADRTQIPLLGSLPVIGVAFRERDETTSRHELVILITPNVVWEKQAYQEGAKQACEFQRLHSVYAEKMSQLSKRTLCRKYVRRAKAAWSMGKRRQALRLAELAVHFDPINREAIELRSDIWLGKPFGIKCPGQQGGLRPAAVIDGAQVSPWLLEQLDRPRGPVNMPPGAAGQETPLEVIPLGTESRPGPNTGMPVPGPQGRSVPSGNGSTQSPPTVAEPALSLQDVQTNDSAVGADAAR